MYSKEQKSNALEVFHQTNSVSETICILGYPTRRQLYTWIATENMVKRERKQLPRFANPPEHPRNPPLDVKLDAIRRCFEQGESIKYVSEDIGYQKPTREYFDYCFEKMKNIDLDQTLIIGDSLSSDIQGGVNVGIDTCWYNPHCIEEPQDMNITYIIHDLRELLDLL